LKKRISHKLNAGTGNSPQVENALEIIKARFKIVIQISSLQTYYKWVKQWPALESHLDVIHIPKMSHEAEEDLLVKILGSDSELNKAFPSDFRKVVTPQHTLQIITKPQVIFKNILSTFFKPEIHQLIQENRD
jgi:hypothetical protein